MLLIIIPFWTNILIRTFAVLELIRNEGTINSVLMWTGIINEPIQMLYTEFSIMLGMTYVYLPLMVLPVYASMERFDFSLVEAGYDLYATRLRVLRRVILPLVKPGVIAGSILVFVPSLGAYVTPRVMGGGNNLMIGSLIELQFGQGRNWPLGAALSITVSISMWEIHASRRRNTSTTWRLKGFRNRYLPGASTCLNSPSTNRNPRSSLLILCLKNHIAVPPFVVVCCY